MPTRSDRGSAARLVAGLAAAAALAVYAGTHWDHGQGWPTLLIAAVLVIAVVLRRFFFPG